MIELNQDMIVQSNRIWLAWKMLLRWKSTKELRKFSAKIWARIWNARNGDLLIGQRTTGTIELNPITGMTLAAGMMAMEIRAIGMHKILMT